jgi:peroxiredoxin
MVVAMGLWLNKTVQSAAASEETAAGGPPRVGQKMADFSLDNLKGIEVRLSDYLGRPVLVNFWTTWCPPCRAEMPLFSDLYLEYEADGLMILAVDVGESYSLAAEFNREQNLPFPVLLDPAEDLADTLQIRAFPTSILVDRDGVVRDIHVGMYTEVEIDREIIPLLESK